jgi:hypothetical protein
MDKKNKFNKQRDLAEKMAQAKRQREGSDDGSSSNTISSSSSSDSSSFTSSLSAAEEIKLRNDRKRFADMLENSLLAGGGGNDMDKGFYLTVEQENENANAVYKGILRLYEGDTAPITPFAELLCIESGEPIGNGGMLRLLPWEGSANNKSSIDDDYLIIITDPRPRSIELRTAMRRITDTLESTILEKVVIINTDTPAENRRLLKKNFGDKDVKFRIFCDENMEWMREYTALGEKVCLNLQFVVVVVVVLLLNICKNNLYSHHDLIVSLIFPLPPLTPFPIFEQRFSMTMFVLKDGRVEKIARDVDAELLPMVVKNSLRNI